MTHNKNQNILYTQMRIIYYGYAMPTFLSTSGIEWVDPNEFDW